MMRAVLVVEAVLVVTAAAMAARIVRTVPAPAEAERGVITRLAWTNESGTVTSAFDLEGRYLYPQLSHDETSVELMRMPGPGRNETWRFIFATRSLERIDPDPAWAAARRLLPASDDLSIVPEDRSPDGRWHALTATRNWLNYTTSQPVGLNEPFLLHSASRAYRLFQPMLSAHHLRFSRDGKRVALTSTLSDRNEVYVADLPVDPGALPIDSRGLVRISSAGGHAPEWGPDQELFYIDSHGDLRTRDRVLFHMLSFAGPEFEYRYGGYCASRDGRFLIALLKKRNAQP